MRGDDSPRLPIKPTIDHYDRDVPDTERWEKIQCINTGAHENGDRNGSASVNTDPDWQLYVCHGCGLRGRAEHIIMKMEGCDFQTAVALAAEYAGTSAEAVLGESRSRSRVSRNTRDLGGSRQYRRVGRGNGRGRRSRESDG